MLANSDLLRTEWNEWRSILLPERTHHPFYLFCRFNIFPMILTQRKSSQKLHLEQNLTHVKLLSVCWSNKNLISINPINLKLYILNTIFVHVEEESDIIKITFLFDMNKIFLWVQRAYGYWIMEHWFSLLGQWYCINIFLWLQWKIMKTFVSRNLT